MVCRSFVRSFVRCWLLSFGLVRGLCWSFGRHNKLQDTDSGATTTVYEFGISQHTGKFALMLLQVNWRELWQFDGEHLRAAEIRRATLASLPPPPPPPVLVVVVGAAPARTLLLLLADSIGRSATMDDDDDDGHTGSPKGGRAGRRTGMSLANKPNRGQRRRAAQRDGPWLADATMCAPELRVELGPPPPPLPSATPPTCHS